MRFRGTFFCYNIAISIDPNYVGAIENRSNALGRQGKFEESIKSFDTMSIESPLAFISFLQKGRTFQENHRLAEAIGCFEKCMSIESNSSKFMDIFINALEGKYQCLMQMSLIEEALVAIDKLIILEENLDKSIETRESQLADSYLKKVDIYVLLNKPYEQAIELFNKAI